MRRGLAIGILLWGLGRTGPANESWPQWRGPHLDGTAEAAGLPVQWSDTENVVWKVAMPAWSGSTPAVWGDRMFVHTPEKSAGLTGEQAQAAGPRRGQYRDPGGDQLFLLCLRLSDGGELWRRPTGGGNRFQMKQNMSSPSPITDGERVWTLTGNGDLRCFDFDGKELWRRNLQDDFGRFGLNHGFASSALLYADRLVIPVLHGMKTDDPSYLAALDKLTGKPLWRVERPTDAVMESPDAYTTPQPLQAAGMTQVVINGADYLTGHDMATGRELWRVGGFNPKRIPTNRTIASSVVFGDTVLAPGDRGNLLMAVKVGVGGDPSKVQTLWTSQRAADVPSVVADGRYVWVVDDRGVFSCLDAQTGKELYPPQRLATGTYSSSPVLADGKIYAINETATTTVLEAGPTFKVLATNELEGGYTLSSPVIVGPRIYLRTSDYLYCVGR